MSGNDTVHWNYMFSVQIHILLNSASIVFFVVALVSFTKLAIPRNLSYVSCLPALRLRQSYS